MKSRNGMGQRRMTAGEKITIGWDPRDARALDPM
jgi:hypothetical protein